MGIAVAGPITAAAHAHAIAVAAAEPAVAVATAAGGRVPHGEVGCGAYFLLAFHARQLGANQRPVYRTIDERSCVFAGIGLGAHFLTRHGRLNDHRTTLFDRRL